MEQVAWRPQAETLASQGLFWCHFWGARDIFGVWTGGRISVRGKHSLVGRFWRWSGGASPRAPPMALSSVAPHLSISLGSLQSSHGWSSRMVCFHGAVGGNRGVKFCWIDWIHWTFQQD